VDYKNTLGPGYSINEHCIDRSVSEKGSILASQANLDRCQATTSYVDFWNCIEGGGPHSAGHRGVGGEVCSLVFTEVFFLVFPTNIGFSKMLNPISSPGDPLFYLHHAWLDQLWWFWQKDDLSRRLTDMGGRNGASTGRGGAGGFGGGASGFFGFGRPDDVPCVSSLLPFYLLHLAIKIDEMILTIHEEHLFRKATLVPRLHCRTSSVSMASSRT